MYVNHELATAVETAIQAAQTAGDLPAFEIPKIVIERTRDAAHGDYACPSALPLARVARMAPLKIATAIVAHLPEMEMVDSAEIAPPGFINFRLATPFIQNLVSTIETQSGTFGYIDIGAGKTAQIEFVSANPTGPISVHRVRGGVIGDTLARALEAARYAVTREYYYNDAGRQITMLGQSTQIRYLQLLGDDLDLEKDHYQGEYIIDIAKGLFDEHGDTLRDQPATYFGDVAKAAISEEQKKTLARVNIIHDKYFNENSLFSGGRLEQTMQILRDNGNMYEKDGAWWLRTTAYGDSDDRIAIRSTDGIPTYRMPDIAYHLDKIERGFDVVVDIFGPDHHAVAKQVLMGVEMLGHNTDHIHTLIHQIVNLRRDGVRLKMSTRAGNYLLLDDLVDEVGVDAVRYFILNRSANSAVEFDVELAKDQSDKNPVYYIQNAHVRCCGIFRKWEAAGLDLSATENADLSLLTHEKELIFLRKALALSEVIELVATTYEPHHLAFYAYDLAATFHPMYDKCRVLHSQVPEPLRLARMRLYGAAKTLFAHVLNLMGMSAPEIM